MTAPVSETQFTRTYPVFTLQVDGSVERLAKELFFKFFCNFWRSLGSSFQRVSLPAKTRSSINQVINQLDPWQRPNARVILSELEYRRTIGPTTIQSYSETVLTDLQFVPNFMFCMMSDELPDSEDKDLIFLPTVLSSGLRDHIVAIVYDHVNNRVELYDSKGLVASDRSEFVRNKEKLTLTEALRRVVSKYGNNETTLWENMAKHQRDSHNCGVFVLNYIKKRYIGMSPEQIAAAGPSFTEADDSCRVALLNEFFLGQPLDALSESIKNTQDSQSESDSDWELV